MPCQQGEPDLMAARKGALEATMQMDLWYTMVAGEVGELNERQSDLLREAEAEAVDTEPVLDDGVPEVVAFDFF